MKFKLVSIERNDAASKKAVDTKDSPKGVNTLSFVPVDHEVAGEFKTVADEARRVVSETNAIACPDAVKDVCVSKGSSPGGTLLMDNMSDADAGRFSVGKEYSLA